MTVVRKDVEEQFYRECAEILGSPHSYKERRFERITRWNNREPGNGRFEGCGLIRMYSLTHIHVCLKYPVVINRMFHSTEETLEFLKKMV